MKLLDRIYTAILIRIYTVLKKRKFFKRSNVFITSGFLKNYKWSLHTSDETYLSGIYDTETFVELKKHLKPSDIVYDLGANEGYYSIVASKIIGEKGTVYAFEPMPENISLLENHIKINSLKNIVVVPKAVSNKLDDLVFTNTNDRAGNTYINSSPKFNESDVRFSVKATTLDHFCFVEKNKLPSLIKIDVEGAEYDVLCGAEKVIKESKPIIIVATHDFHVKGVKDKCINLLVSYGYKYHKLNNYDDPDFSDFLFIHE
jgi:FkbM family methyltransferase